MNSGTKYSIWYPRIYIPKKEGTVGFMTYYHRLNQKLVRNPYPLPIIGNTMQQLEGFQFAAASDLTMGGCSIRLFPASLDMATIFTEFGIFGYNFLPMGMCASGDIFQAKVYEIIGDIEGVKTYIDDILILRKDCFKKHIEQLRIIFGRLCASGFKVNTRKCIFWLKDIPNLGYVITREGIKPELKKL